jgi:UPF0176 protein
MAVLHNQIDKQTALKRLAAETFVRRTVSFYRYVLLEHPEQLRDRLYEQWKTLGVFGRVYLAREGINAQISVPEPQWEAFMAHLGQIPEFQGIPFKMAVEDDLSFWKLAIKVKRQIVADGLKEEDYDVTDVGTHLSPEEFHDALEDKDTLVVDMRNHYESRVGKFVNAITPDADTFREELPMVRELLKGQKDKKILLYCTGGIRCEKASAYLKHQGFKRVHQLSGGIINYAHEMKRKGLPSRFLGKNFVFDARLAEAVTQDVLTSCDQCGKPADSYTNCKNMVCNLLFIQCSECQAHYFNACSDECRGIVQLPLAEQRALRKGVPHTFSRYKKQIRPNEKGFKTILNRFLYG